MNAILRAETRLSLEALSTAGQRTSVLARCILDELIHNRAKGRCLLLSLSKPKEEVVV